jgi:ABC-type multidrug transport system fused ATPase/permease subunit
VPQEPSFFSGSLRFNLDPFAEFSDQEVLNALRNVQMLDIIGTDGLQLQIADQGSNFSVGERQLLSLSRALLQRRRILCMDEAFANVDFATDAKVQVAIQALTQTIGATVLVVAHRMSTLADSNYIVVMGDGRVLEHGEPVELLATGGAYSKMVAQSKLEQQVDAFDTSSLQTELKKEDTILDVWI